MEDFKIVIDQYIPIRDVVFCALREAILTGKLHPGERLMEKQLSEKIGVSRTPVRESLRRLELEGLVEITPRRGAVVSAISEKDIHDVLEVRSSLDALGARLACANMTDTALTSIKKAADEFDRACKASDIRLSAETDQAFHSAIFSAAGNDKLIQIINNLSDQMYRYRFEYLKSEKHTRRIAGEHRELIKALSAKDANKAEEIAIRHIVNQEEIVVGIIRG